MPGLHHPAFALVLLSAMATTALLAPASAQAQVRRCTTPDGGTVYTDRNCAALGAVETRPQGDGGGASPALRYRGGCSRRLQDLVFEVTSAIDARDTNWLARSYHWAGVGHSNGYALLERLDAIARRPLLNVTALRPAQTVVVPAQQPGAAAGWSTGASATLDGNPLLAAAPSAPQPRRPVALRIDQVLADGVTPSTTTFGLRRHMDCWWITL